jgi:hypothetical protein
MQCVQPQSLVFHLKGWQCLWLMPGELSLQQAVKTHRVVRRWGSHIFSRQTAHRWRCGCQPYPPAALYFPGRFLVLISVRGWVDPRAIVRLEGWSKLKKIHLIGTLTHYLPFCSIVPQPTTLPHAPILGEEQLIKVQMNSIYESICEFIRDLREDIIACRPVARWRPRGRRLYGDRC